MFPGPVFAQNEIVGTWHADEYSLWEKGIAYLKGSRSIVFDKEIIIHADSTYQKTYVKAISTGKWHIANDSLFLTPDNSFLQNDSITVNPNITLLHNRHESFSIRPNRLITYHPGNFCKRRKEDGSIKRIEHFQVEILKKR
jgi:hypothetical protein